MSQLKYITFSTVAGGTQTLALQDYDKTIQVETWADNDTALSGRKRQNVRGFRRAYRISYQASIEPAAYRAVFNNILTDMLAGEETITVSEGTDLSNAVLVVPTDEFRHAVEYISQISEFVPTLEFIESTVNRFALSYVASGYVDYGYVEGAKVTLVGYMSPGYVLPGYVD